MRSLRTHAHTFTGWKDSPYNHLVDLEKSDPWKYLKYQVTTLANLYSAVHWSHIKAR
jgi:hypothetical protein